MHKFFRNNIFTNPIGWVKQAVGRKWIYRFMQVCTIFNGIILFFIFKIFYSSSDFLAITIWIHLCVGVVIFYSTIFLPLLCLKALRYLYLHFSDEIENVLADKQVKAEESKNEESFSPPT